MLKTLMENGARVRRMGPKQDRTARSSPPQVADLLWAHNSLIFLIAAGELLALILAIASQGPGTDGWLVHFGLYSFAVQWNVMFTLGCLYLIRRWLRYQPMSIFVLVIIGTIIVVTLGSSVLSHWLFNTMLAEPGPDWLTSGIKLAVSLVCMTLLALLVLRVQWAAHQHRLRAQQAELEALRARVNPHFLFNTLNTASALVHQQPAQAEQVLLDLSDLFRAALSGHEEIELERELWLTRRYLEIESLRLGDRLEVAWHLPEPLPRIRVPALALQTLAENAVRHGIERLLEKGQLVIAVEAQEQRTVLRVTNPVTSDPPTATRSAGHQVGLAASRMRIEAMTAGQGSLRTGVEAGQFVAEISLPREPSAGGRA